MTETANIAVDSDGDQVMVAGRGELNLHTASEFKKALKSALASGKDIQIDFRNVRFIDSAIMACLVETGKALKRAGRELCVIVARDGQPEYSLRIAGLKMLMQIVVDDGPPAHPRKGG